MLNRVVEQEVILELQETAARKEWKKLARHLGIKDETINKLKSDYDSEGIDEMFYNMMSTWQMQEGNQATYKKLIKALEKCRLQQAIDKIKPLLGK